MEFLTKKITFLLALYFVLQLKFGLEIKILSIGNFRFIFDCINFYIIEKPIEFLFIFIFIYIQMKDYNLSKISNRKTNKVECL